MCVIVERVTFDKYLNFHSEQIYSQQSSVVKNRLSHF